MTRRTSKLESLTVIWTSFDTIVEVLNELIKQNKDKIIKEEVQLLHWDLTSYDLILILMFIYQVLFKTNILAEKLQTKQLDLVIANKNSGQHTTSYMLSSKTDQIEREIETSKAAVEKS